jgi:hypothetical protein
MPPCQWASSRRALLPVSRPRWQGPGDLQVGPAPSNSGPWRRGGREGSPAGGLANLPLAIARLETTLGGPILKPTGREGQARRPSALAIAPGTGPAA